MRAKDKELHTIIFACSHLHIFKRLISVRVTYNDHDYEVLWGFIENSGLKINN